MAEMVFLQCDNGSKAVCVACPKCERISLQILKDPYRGGSVALLDKELTCPVCGSVYRACSTSQTREWSAAFGRYNLNGNAYNSAVKDNYARQQEQKNTNQQAKYTPIDCWKDIFKLSVLKPGETLARKGLVRDLVITAESFSANVQGDDLYQVRIDIKNQGVAAVKCTCPIGTTGLCKHMAAVLFVAADGVQKETPAFLPAKQTSQRTNAKAETGAALTSVIQQHLASTPAAKTLEVPTAKVDATPVSNPVLNTPTIAPASQPAEASNVSGYAEAASLERKIGRWKRELLDTGKRNKMINYRETSRSTLKILEPGLEELFNKLAISEKELTFQKPINKDTDYRTYAFLSLLETLSYSLPVHVGDIKASGTIVEREKTLKNLRSKTKLAREEQGTNILYLSFGFILWRETDRPNAVWMKAPLLMMPVSLELKSMNAPYTISRYEDDIEVNPTLDYLFNSEYGIDLPTFELKDKKSITDYLDTIEEIVDRRGWKLVREVSLGLLSFQKINMYHDLNNDYNHDLIMRHPVLRSMGGDYSAIKGLPPELQNYDFDKVDPQDTYQVVNADSSQQEAILLSKRGVSFVMQGPPGTGKSQTITNIISEALADGKKILFVSEKAAALQIVLKRLTEVGLADFCLSLHDYKANKKEIIDNIGANLSLTEQRLPRSAVSDLTELLHNREALNEYAIELHRSVAPLNTSIYSAFGRITQLESASAIEFQIQDPLAVSEATFSEMLYSVEMYERALHAMGLLHENPWYMTTAKSSGQAFKQQIESQTKNLSTKLPAIEAKIRVLNLSWHLHVSETMVGTQKGIEEIKQVITLPLFPIKWMDEDVRKKLLEITRTEKAAQTEHHDRIEKFKKHYLSEAQIAKMHQERLNEALAQLRMSWDDAALALNAEEIKAKYASAYATTDKPIAECIRETAKASSKIKTLAEKALACFADAKEILSLAQIDAFANLYFCAKLISILVDAPYMETEWFDLRTNADVLPLLEDACKRCEMLENKTVQLLEKWEPGILSIAVDEMLARFKTEYSGLFYKLKGSYKEDIKTLKLLAKQVGVQITDEVAIAVLQAVKEINNEKAWFEENSGQLTAVFKSQFKGANTDWDKLRYGVTSAKKIAEMFPYANIPADVIAAIQTAILSTQKSAEIRRLNDELSEEKVAELENAIQMLSYIDMSEDDISISGTYIAQIDAFLADCTNQEEQLYAVVDCYKGDKATITYQNLASMLDLVAAIRKEREWFGENRVTLESLYADSYTGEATDWGAICDTMNIGQAATVREWMSEFSAKESGLTQLFADRYTGIETDWQSLTDDLEDVAIWVETRKTGDAITDAFIEMICGKPEQRISIINPALQQSTPTAINTDIVAEYNRQNGIQDALLSEGTVICDKYVVESRLEVSSGEADLYLCAFDGKKYVAKLYRRKFAVKESVVEALLKVDSPYVAKLYETGLYNGFPVEIIPYYENGSLQGKLFSEAELIETIIPNINEGLKALHAVGVIHKDLKPSNLMLNDDGETISIIDFGISSAIEGDQTVLITKTGMTPEYSAPETFRNIYYEGSDYYSFGITLFELCCGYTPYANMQQEEIEQYGSLQKIPFPAEMSPMFQDFLSALTYYDITNRKNQNNPNRRWTYDEVKRWLDGDDTLIIPGEGVGNVGKGTMPAFQFLGESYTDEGMLVVALAQNWEEGKKQLFRGHITAHFKLFDTEAAQKCAAAEEAAQRENGKDDIIYWNLLYQIAPKLKGFYWKGYVFESLPAFGRDALDRLWSKDHAMFPYYASILSEKLLTQYVKLVAPKNETLKKAAAAIEDSYALEVTNGTDMRRTYYLMAYTISGQKLLFLDGQKFRTVGELAAYMKDTLETSRQNFESLCHRMVDYDGNLDFQLETWLIAIGKQKELEKWRTSMNE